MNVELRQVRYFVAVAEELNFTRAAERLHIAQPPLSAAIRQLEAQLGVSLLARTTRTVELTPAGRVLLERGRALLTEADAVFAAVRETEHAPIGRVALGVAPTARFGVAPDLFTACASYASGVMLYPREDTTGALLHDLRAGRVDLVVGFCAPEADDLEREPLRDEPAVVHLPATHRLAGRASLRLEELREETLIVAGGRDSPGYTQRVLELCHAAGFDPAVVADPYPDLGLQAVREGLGIVVYVRSAFPAEVENSVFVPLEGDVTMPFELLWRPGSASGALQAVLTVARELRMAS